MSAEVSQSIGHGGASPAARDSLLNGGTTSTGGGGSGGGLHVLQSAPEAEASFYSLPFVEALRACVRHWNVTAGGEHTHRSGATASGVAGQGTGLHVLTQDRILVESHYTECYGARHPAVLPTGGGVGAAAACCSSSSQATWPCPIHTAGAPPRAAEEGDGAGASGHAHGAGSRRGSRRSSAVDANNNNNNNNTTGAAGPSSSSPNHGTRESLATEPAEVDLSTPAGAQWMVRTAGIAPDTTRSPPQPPSQASVPRASGDLDGKLRDVMWADRESAEALRLLRAGLRRALGFPARDEGLLAVDDLVLGYRSETRATYSTPHRTGAQTDLGLGAAARHSSQHVDAVRGTHAAGAAAGSTAAADADADATESVIRRHVPDNAWRAAPLPLAPTPDEYTPHLSVWRREDDGDTLRESALLEWFTDILEFADRLSFSTVQLRCVLLDAMGLLETLYEVLEATSATHNDATSATTMADEDHAVEEALTASLQDALSAQACPVTMRAVERQTVDQPVPREVPDPAVVGPLERRLATEKLNKKQQQQLRDQIASAPRITQVEIQSTVVEAEREITVGPYFNLHETASILEHLTSSVVTQWRLWRLLLCAPQPEATQTFRMTYQDTLPFCVPPLSQFCPDTHYDQVLAHHALYVEACCSLESAFEALFAEPMRALEAEKLRALETMHDAQRRDMQENHANTLNAEEFDRVERAFLTRLNQKLLHNDVMSGSVASLLATAALGGEETRRSLVPTPPPPTDGPKSAKGKNGKRATNASRKGSASRRKTQNALGTTLEASRVGAESVVLPADAVFSIDAVEQRVDATQQELNAKMEAANATKKKGK